MSTEIQAELQTQVERRRNFAIISHPDAGKTTLTEKLLLYGGAIHQAGAVKARRAQRHATSDWMEMEQQRGISITSTVLQFDYKGFQINLLDTPGHQDFSEDTYRTLAAADNAVMLIDAAKGLEPQTRKLFEVCRLRGLPIFTFVNKLDRPGREPLELLDEIEQELGLATYAANWPIGMGDRFKGVFERSTQKIHLFERSAHGQREAVDTIVDFGDPRIEQLLEQDLYYQFKDDLELLEGVGSELDLEAVHAGVMTPVFFGSAMTNFGVEPFLNAFLDYALKPTPHVSNQGEIEPTYPEFSGFIFKLQANMDPKHRDRVAFVRVCSGKFEKDMTVNHARTGKLVRLSRPQKLFAQDREVIETAYPGDVIGLNNPGVFAIGDTIYVGQKLEYEGIPSFSPELFAYLKNPNPSKFKQFQKGVQELREEGAVQIMHSADDSKREPILAAVGQLQFEVVQFRMQSEYGVETTLELLPYSVARWVVGGWEALEKAGRLFNTVTVKDSWNRPVLLFRNEWNVGQVEADHPELKLNAIAPRGFWERTRLTVEVSLKGSKWESTLMTSPQSSTNAANLTDLEAGLAAFKQEDYSTAALLLENSLSKPPDQPLIARAQMALAIAYERLGETVQAAQVCQQLQNSSSEQVQTWATRTLGTLTQRHPHLAHLNAIPDTSEEQPFPDAIASSMDRSGFVPLPSPLTQSSSQTGFIPLNPASEPSDLASHPVSSAAVVPPIATNKPVVEPSINFYQPTWRNAGRAKNWKPFGQVKRLQLAAIQIVTAIALFVGIQQLLYWVFASYETMVVRLLPRLGFSVVQSGAPRWTVSFTAVLLLVILASSRWILDGLLTVLYGLQPLTLPKLAGYSPETTQLLPRFCRQHGISSPSLGILPTQEPIAFTYGAMPAISRIVVSQGLLDQLADDEIAAIYANELGHLANWDVPLMSVAIVILQIPYTLYRVVADWGSQKTAVVSRASASLIAAFSYGLYWLLHWIPLWLSRQRIYYSDRVATDLTGNPNGYTRALLKIAIGTAKDVQHQKQTSYLLEGFDLLMPLNHRAAISLGSLYPHLPIEPLLQWEGTNPYRQWLAINSSHPPTGDRLQLLSLYARHWQLDPELNWQSMPTQKSRKSTLTAQQWRNLLLQGAPYFGIVLGLLVAYLLVLIGWVSQQFSLEAISWMAGDRTLLRGLPFIGFCVGTIIRINPFFPEIRPSSLKASAANLSLADATQQAALLPINSHMIRLEGRVLGRPEINNHLNQDLLLETATGIVKLHCTSRFGFLGDLFPKATRPADLVNHTVVATGWLRRGTTSWLDVDTLRSSSGRVSQSAHPVWSTVAGAIAALLGILTILNI